MDRFSFFHATKHRKLLMNVMALSCVFRAEPNFRPFPPHPPVMNGKKKQETKKEKVNDSVKKDEEEESRVKQKGKKKKLKLNRKLYE